MNTTASAVVPSREAVETFTPSNGAMICCAQGTGHYVKTEDYRTLLAEVERLTKEYAAVNNERGSQTAVWPDAWKYVAELKASNNSLWQENEQLRTTVADQAAALAERDKDAERYRIMRTHEGTVADPVELDRVCDEMIDAALAASVSSASEEGK